MPHLADLTSRKNPKQSFSTAALALGATLGLLGAFTGCQGQNTGPGAGTAVVSPDPSPSPSPSSEPQYIDAVGWEEIKFKDFIDAQNAFYRTYYLDLAIRYGHFGESGTFCYNQSNYGSFNDAEWTKLTTAMNKAIPLPEGPERCDKLGETVRTPSGDVTVVLESTPVPRNRTLFTVKLTAEDGLVACTHIPDPKLAADIIASLGQLGYDAGKKDCPAGTY